MVADMVSHRIISIVIAFGIFMGLSGFTAGVSSAAATGPLTVMTPDTSLACAYRVLGERDLPTVAGRTAKEYCILSSADSFKKRAQTAIQAALDLQKKSGADYVSIKLTPIPKGGCIRYTSALAGYSRDGGGPNGKAAHAVWSVKASGIVLGPEEILVALAWEEARPEIAINGRIDPDKMSKYLSKQLNLSPKEVKAYWLRCLEMGMTLRPYPVDTGQATQHSR